MERSEPTLPEARYRRLFETAPDGILILDARTGEVEDANPLMTELLGYTRAELLGKPLWDIGLFKDVENSRTAFQRLRQTGMMRYDNLPLQRRDGTIQEVEFVSNVYNEDGRDVIQCNIRDITERRRLERRLEEYARTIAATDRRKSEFLAILSHELRNPMAAISGALPLLARATLDGSQTRALAVVNRQLAHLTRLLDDLLDVNRIETGQMTMVRVPISVDDVVEAAIESSSPVVQAAQHRLDVTMPDEQLWIDVDPGRISQVIDNLLTNAAKYTPHGGSIALTVSRSVDQAVFRVTDTGMGIPEEQQRRLFDMFVRADADGSHNGLGVGLAIAKRIVETHGGTIEAHSAGRGRGAEFVVRLPLVRAADRRSRTASAVSRSAGRRLKVLVVDDNHDLVEMMELAIDGMGHEVRKATDGETAISVALAFRPDVVLLDIGLPIVSGLEVARRLRQRPELSHVRLIAMTGWGQAADRRQTAEVGFDHHLTKPVDPAELETLLAMLPAQATVAH